MGTTHRLRIDFQVREILEEGTDPGDARYTTFYDEIDFDKIGEFFERSGSALDMMFNAGSCRPAMVKFTSPPPNKILAIKIVREITGCGLKDAKDAVEQPVGCPIVMFEDYKEASAAVDRFRSHGISEAVFEKISREKFNSLCSKPMTPPTVPYALPGIPSPALVIKKPSP